MPRMDGALARVIILNSCILKGCGKGSTVISETVACSWVPKNGEDMGCNPGRMSCSFIQKIHCLPASH